MSVTVFISIPWFSPAFRAGGPVQSIANMVNELREGYAFYIFCSHTDLHGEPLQITNTNQWLQHNPHTKVWYNGPQNRSRHLVTQLEEISPDILYIIGVFNWHFNLVPLLFAKAPQKIVSVRGSLHPGAMGQKSFKKRPFLLAMKMLKWTKWTAFQATDLAESSHIQDNLGEAANIFIAGNFPRMINRQHLPVKTAGGLKLVSVGIISRMKNILLVLQSLQQLKSVVEYNIYGPVKDAPYWEDCQRQIKLLPSNIKVCYHKEIEPQKVAEILSTSHLFILPSKSENYGHAMYEAMSAGLPVITSDFTHWNELEKNKAGINVKLKATVIAKAIDFFAEMDEDHFAHWSQGASSYAKTAVDKTKLISQYEEMFAVKSKEIMSTKSGE